MEVVLFMLLSGKGHRAFPVSKSAVVLGRREDCDFRIPLADVSRQHCRVVIDAINDQVTGEDLGSANGTRVNGKRIKTSPLRAGDLLEVGPVKFVVQIDGIPPDEGVLEAAESGRGFPKLARGTQHAGPASSLEQVIDDALSGDPSADSDDSDVFLPVDGPK